MGSVEQEVEAVVQRLSEEYGRQVDNLERRIKKLTQSLDETGRALAEMARLKNIDPGISSVYRTVQGLSFEDPIARAKEEMLARIFEANLELQGR